MNKHNNTSWRPRRVSVSPAHPDGNAIHVWPWLVALARSFRYLAVFVLLFGSFASAQEPNCGTEGGRPCTVFERVPSCDPYLLESAGKCVHPACGRSGERACVVTQRIPSCDGGLVETNGRCAPSTPCGAEGARACLIFERVPSCNASLVESAGKCVHPPCGRQGERACGVTERIPSCDSGLREGNGRCLLPTPCGGNGERACPVFERVPSCNASLVESAGKCVHPPCGRQGERACGVTERIPSCDSGLREGNGRCVLPTPCGDDGQRACMVFERVPSCNPALVESAGKCVHPPCGRMGERACVVTVRIPSCDPGLVEAKGSCVPPTACGGEGGRACLVFERVPSCDADLVESAGKCVHPACGRTGERACVVTERIPSCDRGLVEAKGRCGTPTACGGEGLRACLVVERVPSCDANLVESAGKCMHPACGRVGERACVVTERIPSCDRGLVEANGRCATTPCGAEGGRACLVTERVPSCNPYLVESAGKCVHPACGRIGERACVVTERIPSCDALLVEASGKCIRLPCGAEGQRPCLIKERLPSCDPNLVEYGGKCVAALACDSPDAASGIVAGVPIPAPSRAAALMLASNARNEPALAIKPLPGALSPRPAIGARAAAPAPAQPAPAKAALLVGAGVSDITGPAAEVNMMGYADISQATAGMHTRLLARAFVFANPANGKRVVFVSAELGQLFGALKQGVIKRLAQRYGNLYDDRNVQIAATHTHSGPGGYAHYTLYNLSTLGFIPQSYDAIVDGITRAIVQAHDRLAPATLGFNFGDIAKPASRNRSLEAFRLNREGCSEAAELQGKCTSINPEVSLLRVDRPGGPAGVIAWFSVHNTSLSKNNHLIGADSKGFAAYQFERLFGSIAPFQRPGEFVAAFPNGDEGDMSPNLGHNFVPPGLNKDYTRPAPASDDYQAVELIGSRQFDAAKRLFENANGGLRDIGAEVDFRHMFVQMPGYPVGKDRLCSGALGLSFAAGAEDGPSGMPVFREGMVAETKFGPSLEQLRKDFGGWSMPENLRNEFHRTNSLDNCHYPKPVLIPGGALGWTPETLPFQLLRVGSLAIAGVPSEMTVQSGRRLRARILAALRPVGVTNVIITGLANEYSGYVTTPEEYDSQQYEGASTLFGRNTLDGYLQIFGQLAEAMAAGKPVPPGPTPPDLSSVPKFTLQTPVIFDDKRIVEKFGQVLAEPPTAVGRGNRVEASFRAGHPKNGLRSNDTYLAVERNVNGNWVAVAWDAMPETRFMWRHDEALDCKACSFFDARWDVPASADPGTYRIRHFGAWKNGVTGKTCGYEGATRTFEVK